MPEVGFSMVEVVEVDEVVEDVEVVVKKRGKCRKKPDSTPG